MQQVLSVREDVAAVLQAAAAEDPGVPGLLPCGCASLASCSCLAGKSTAAQAAAALSCCHQGLEVSAGAACPLTGLTLSQIAELKRSPPEALQRDWKDIAQRLE